MTVAHRILAAGLSLALLGAPAVAGLIPPEIVVLFVAGDKNSKDIAQHYAKARNIPTDHLLPIDVPRRSTITPDIYNDQVKRPLRKFLEAKSWGRTIRCLVTCYDFPLRVAARPPRPNELQRATELARSRAEVATDILNLVHQMEVKLAHAAGKPAPPMPEPVTDLNIRADAIGRPVQDVRRLEKNIFDANGLLAHQPYPEFLEDASKLVLQADGGLAYMALLQQMRRNLDGAQLDNLDTASQALEAAIDRAKELAGKPRMDPARNELRTVTGQLHGLVGLLELLDGDVRALRGQDTSAALDSELSLLWYDDYDRYRWQPNAAYIHLPPQQALDAAYPLPDHPDVMMVSRLDAPNVDTVINMIDNSIAVEQTGLTGTFYIDARGLDSHDAFGAFDKELVALADLVRNHTDLPVVLDQHAALFPENSCKNTALYAGWYAPKSYLPAFQFLPGSIGVHYASFELISIKGGGPPYWCPGMLADGVAATFGPTDEPYLHSFGKPAEFFGLLLTGKYTLVECFFYTNPLCSWQQALVGDPLYRPFAANPKLELEEVLPPDLLPLQPIATRPKLLHEENGP